MALRRLANVAPAVVARRAFATAGAGISAPRRVSSEGIIAEIRRMESKMDKMESAINELGSKMDEMETRIQSTQNYVLFRSQESMFFLFCALAYIAIAIIAALMYYKHEVWKLTQAVERLGNRTSAHH